LLQRLAAGPIQPKLSVGPAGDRYEREADAAADRAVAGKPVGWLSRLPSMGLHRQSETEEEEPAQALSNAPAVQRKCPACEEEAQRQADEKDKPVQTKARANEAGLDTTAAESAMARCGLGNPLGDTLRRQMEGSFGADFSAVRVHTGSAAREANRAINARAFTHGADIYLGPGESATDTRLMAHELAHTLQQSQARRSTVQRFVPCTRARLSGEECPHRVRGEDRMARGEPSILVFITSPEKGYLITNFDIGESRLKASAKLEPDWSEMIRTISKAGSEWELWGLSDCHGDETLNRSLRQKRADAVRAALPPTAAAHIVGASGVSKHDCITDNSTRHHRAWNRAVLIKAVKRDINFEPEEIEVKPPTVKKADTEDCSRAQRNALSRAQALAIRMVQAAFSAIDDRGPLLTTYFGRDAVKHRFHIRQNFSAISKGLKHNPTFECEAENSWWCDGAHARVVPVVGDNIHICQSAIDKGEDFLARTIVHEAAHRFAWIFIPDKLCEGGTSLDTLDSEDNADCYGEFAGEALQRSR
jgi:outer membrane protein OmpA-like peptidoglycan-associated protein